jgi:hypothetical protein
MISCYELRLGNRVLVNNELHQVSGITATSVFTNNTEEGSGQPASEYGLAKVEPIALTDELLKECGFVFHHYFKFWQLITTGIRSEMDLSPDYEVIDFMRKPILKKLDSLHQLQNIYFMLKGRELKFAKRMMQAV